MERTALAAAVRHGLSMSGQKELPTELLYDDVGTALFEVICLLPEYGLTRAGRRLLARHAGEMVAHLPSRVVVAELGARHLHRLRRPVPCPGPSAPVGTASGLHRDQVAVTPLHEAGGPRAVHVPHEDVHDATPRRASAPTRRSTAAATSSTVRSSRHR